MGEDIAMKTHSKTDNTGSHIIRNTFLIKLFNTLNTY